MSTPASDSSAEKIQSALDKLVAERRAGGAATWRGIRDQPAAPRVRRFGTYFLIGLTTLAVHAGMFYVMQGGPSEPVVTGASAPVEVAIKLPVTGSVFELAPAPVAPVVASQPEPSRVQTQTKVGIIEHDGRVMTYPLSSRPVAPTPRPGVAHPGRTVVVAPLASPAPPRSSPAPAAASIEAHAEAAKNHAYQYFRYKYKVGSGNYGVTSLNVVVTDTAEVPQWRRHRSTGEAGLEYYDGSGFRRTTRRFEVLTEEKNGRVSAIEIDVRW